jgi:hypothetical protein
MTINRRGTDKDSAEHTVVLNRDPDNCPLCHHGISPRFLVAHLNGSTYQAAYRCPRIECQHIFVGHYARNPKTGHYDFAFSDPTRPQSGTYPETVATLSPTAIEIMNQVAQAEARKLDQLVGIGLRKALEFLIKDYLIAAYPDKADDIKKTMLGPCITTFVVDPNIKACASRATWLGNDETHYIRKWEDKDIKDLKQLVRLTINWIENEALTKQYMADMNPEPKKA